MTVLSDRAGDYEISAAEIYFIESNEIVNFGKKRGNEYESSKENTA
jgi:hypothetical protein